VNPVVSVCACARVCVFSLTCCVRPLDLYSGRIIIILLAIEIALCSYEIYLHTAERVAEKD
jgi:hypothetical protein